MGLQDQLRDAHLAICDALAFSRNAPLTELRVAQIRIAIEEAQRALGEAKDALATEPVA